MSRIRARDVKPRRLDTTLTDLSKVGAVRRGSRMEGQLTLDVSEMDGSCHCGTVRFHVRLSDGLRTARRCTCSICRMRGAIAVSAQLDGLDILSGADALSLYQFNTMSAKHYFCSRCGIYTHHHRRSTPNQYAINVACLEGISPFDFAEVPVNDGVNHPSDNGGALNRLGVLKFVRSEETRG